MANAFYGKGIEAWLEGSIAALSDTIKASLVTTGYTPSINVDQFYSTISGGNITAAGVALSSKTGSLGTLSAANLIWTSVSGSTSSYIVIYKDTGSSSTSPLLVLIDTATGLPVTPNGGDITVAWSSGQVLTLCKGLDPVKEPGLVRLIQEWMRDHLRIPAVRGPGGLWIPQPRLIQAPAAA